MTPVPGEKFYFGRKMIDISATNSEVPRVDSGTIAPYDQLGLADEFYRGQVDAGGRLTYLETWQREHEDEIPLDTLIEGKPLGEYDVPIAGSDTSRQTPQFFAFRNDEWHPIPVARTQGESRFVRLRWLKSLDDDALMKDAEILQQSLGSTNIYSYDPDGTLTKIVRELGTTNVPETIYAPPER